MIFVIHVSICVKMSYLIDICFICLKHSNNLVIICSQDTHGVNFEDKLKYFLPGFEFNSNIPKYICAKCGRNLSRIREFKQICLRNITTYEKYAQQITTTDSSYKYLSVVLSPDLVCKQSEGIIKEEANVELELNNDVKEENEEIADSKDFIIEQETNKELVSNDQLDALLFEIIKNKSGSDETCNEHFNEQTFQTGNENECPNNDEKEEIYTCEICKKAFKQLHLLKYHYSLHTGKKLLKYLEQHEVRHIPKIYTCEVCNKSFTHSQHLQEHKLSHNKKYTCEVCNKSFQNLSDLEQHELFAEKPYSCEFCQETFGQYYALKQHILLHSKEKLYACEVCQKSFRSPKYLKNHKLVHISGNSSTCEICHKSFSKYSLEKHKRVHTNKN